MSVTRRHYRADDALSVSEFLIRHHQEGNRDGNWLQPAWEYALTHPMLDSHSLGCNTVWEDDGEIVAAVHFEHRLGEAFFQVSPSYTSLKPAMLDCAEVYLRAGQHAGHVELRAFVNDSDSELEGLVQSRGYARLGEADRPLSRMDLGGGVKVPDLPPGFRLQSLADDNDLREMDRVLWRGFGHPGDPPPESIDGRRKMQSGPNYRTDLAIVAVCPDGHFGAFCGGWMVPRNGYAYLEPVATDPDHRRRGLGRAVVLETLRRCASEGATVGYVGADVDFYRAIGFSKSHSAHCWVKRFDR